MTENYYTAPILCEAFFYDGTNKTELAFWAAERAMDADTYIPVPYLDNQTDDLTVDVPNGSRTRVPENTYLVFDTYSRTLSNSPDMAGYQPAEPQE